MGLTPKTPMEFEPANTAPLVQAERLIIRAFRTKAIGTESIVFAKTASKARYITYLAAKDAGYEVGIIEVSVKRAAEYDLRKFDSHYGFKGDPIANWCYKAEHLLSV
jgi:hypothetical protein